MRNDQSQSYFRGKYEKTYDILSTFEKTFSQSLFLGMSHKESKYIRSPLNKQFSIENYLNKNKVYDPLNFEPDAHILKLINEEKLNELNQILISISKNNKTNTREKNNLDSFEKYWECFLEVGFDYLNEHAFFKNLIAFQDVYVSFYHFFYLHSTKYEDNELMIIVNELKNKLRFIIENIEIIHDYCKNEKKIIDQESLKILKYNAKVIQSTVMSKINQYLPLIILGRKPYINKEFFKKINRILLSEITKLDLSQLHKILIKEITKTIRPNGFFDKNDQLKQIFMTGKFMGFAEKCNNRDDNEVEAEPKKNIPYLPENKKKYTIFFELDVFINFPDEMMNMNEKSLSKEFKKRPLTDEFFRSLRKDYEFVLFTRLDHKIASQILIDTDIQKYVDHLLSNDFLTSDKNKLIKDLRNTGRPLEKCLILETKPEKFKIFKENGIWIEKWKENEEKNSLEFFIKLLNQIKGENLILNLKRFRDFTIRKITTKEIL